MKISGLQGGLMQNDVLESIKDIFKIFLVSIVVSKVISLWL